MPLYFFVVRVLSESRARADVVEAREMKGGVKTPQNTHRLRLDSNSIYRLELNETKLE